MWAGRSPAVEPFGRHVGECSYGGAGLGEGCQAHGACDAEIDEVDEPFGVDERVRWFDVAMDQPGFVCGVECAGHLLDDADRDRGNKGSVSA